MKEGGGPTPLTIVSGGQTGVDRAALDVAIARGVAHGGWCPRGRLAEDGRIDARYALEETSSSSPAVRTRRNVVDSDATVVFSSTRAVTGGTALTIDLAAELGRPWLHLTAEKPLGANVARLLAFVDRHGVRRLNVAGPRASGDPRAAALAAETLEALLTVLCPPREPESDEPA